ncbi:GAF and ANTAR domain-containing protein [Amycolatopsis orientalis]|uniref:GAF and ANTAR domain-containing protein n=1 Tax=Amycolatopsis orientalis TaxID=31958 RepID=UPI0003A0879E|nr:GAF and ANTAR domain-containing protein [Amycolatopsis orientalis]
MSLNDETSDHVDDPRVVRRVDEVTGALERLSDTLDQEEGLPAILHRLCQQVVPAIPGADHASVSVVSDGVPRTVAATADEAGTIAAAQYDAGSGPALEAARTGKVVRVTVSDEATGRWPGFVSAARDASVGSYLSAPLYLDEEFSGSLTLYGAGDHGFSDLDAALLELYTTAAEAALRQAQRHRTARTTVDELRTALSSRAVIDQAKGILMAVRRVTADEAFEILVGQSQRTNVKLRTLAQQFVDEVCRPGTDG